MQPKATFNITLPLDMAEMVENKVRSGAYASVSDIVRDGVGILVDRDNAIEHWLREEIVAGHAEYTADETRGIPADELLERIKARHSASKIR